MGVYIILGKHWTQHDLSPKTLPSTWCGHCVPPCICWISFCNDVINYTTFSYLNKTAVSDDLIFTMLLFTPNLWNGKKTLRFLEICNFPLLSQVQWKAEETAAVQNLDEVTVQILRLVNKVTLCGAHCAEEYARASPRFALKQPRCMICELFLLLVTFVLFFFCVRVGRGLIFSGRVQHQISSLFQPHKPGKANYTVHSLPAISARDHSGELTQSVIVPFGNLFQPCFCRYCCLRGGTTMTSHYVSVYTGIRGQ